MAREDIKLAASSHVNGAAYDDETEELAVTFAGGGTYVYSGVPQSVVTGLRTALSPGQYLNQAVKGQFDYKKAK